MSAQGISKIIGLVRVVEEKSDARIPPLARVALRTFAAQFELLQVEIRSQRSRSSPGVEATPLAGGQPPSPAVVRLRQRRSPRR